MKAVQEKNEDSSIAESMREYLLRHNLLHASTAGLARAALHLNFHALAGPTKLAAVAQEEPESVDATRKPPENGEQDVDEEANAASAHQENGERRQENATDDDD